MYYLYVGIYVHKFSSFEHNNLLLLIISFSLANIKCWPSPQTEVRRTNKHRWDKNPYLLSQTASFILYTCIHKQLFFYDAQKVVKSPTCIVLLEWLLLV